MKFEFVHNNNFSVLCNGYMIISLPWYKQYKLNKERNTVHPSHAIYLFFVEIIHHSNVLTTSAMAKVKHGN